MNRLKRLAKLRQYKDGNIADYLRTEHRQNLLAIEDALNIPDSSQSTTVTIESGALLFVAHISGTFTGVVNLSTAANKVIFGSLSGGDYVLPEAGQYAIKYGFHVNLANTTGTAASTLSLIDQSVPSTLQTIAFNVPIPANNTVMAGGTNTYLFTALSASPIRFSVSNSNCTPNRFWCEIFKVG